MEALLILIYNGLSLYRLLKPSLAFQVGTWNRHIGVNMTKTDDERRKEVESSLKNTTLEVVAVVVSRPLHDCSRLVSNFTYRICSMFHRTSTKKT